MTDLEVVEGLIKKRRSIRKYTNRQLTRDEINKLVEVAMLVPSAGAIHPLSVHVVPNDRQEKLCIAALGQTAVREASVAIIITANVERMLGKYRSRGLRYAYMEAGHAGQNVALTALAMGLDTVMVGAFVDERVIDVMELTSKDLPLYIICVGEKG